MKRHNQLPEDTKGYIKFFYINTSEIPGFFILLKNHIFIVHSEDTIFIFHTVKIFLFDNIFLLSL